MVESDLRIDIIRGKSSRKSLVSVDVKTFELFAQITNKDELKTMEKQVQTVICAADMHDTESCWCAVFSKGGEDGRSLLVINPNEKILNILFRYIPPKNIRKSV